jgi:hypothetical protein
MTIPIESLTKNALLCASLISKVAAIFKQEDE